MKTSWMKKVAITATAGLLLAACSGGGGSGDDGPTDPNAKIELTFANWQWMEPGRGDKLWDSILKYQDEHPNVTFKRQEITRADYEKTLQTQMGAGGGPDLLIVPPAMLPELGEADLLVPLDGVSEEGNSHIADETYNGQRLAYTWEVVNFGFFWNKKLFEEAGIDEAPTDMAGVLAAAEAITEKTGKPGFAVRNSMNEEQPWWTDFANWIYGYGGAWSADGELTINDPHNVEAVAGLKELYDSGSMPVGDDASTFRSRFKNGEIGMMFDNASVLFTMLDGNDKLTSDDIGVATLPFPTDNSSQITNFVGVSQNSKNREAAMDVVRWLSSEEGQEATAGGIFPTLNATAAAPPADIVEKYPWIETYREQSATATGSPVITDFELQTPQIRTIVLKAVESVLVNDQDPAQALEQAQQAAGAL